MNTFKIVIDSWLFRKCSLWVNAIETSYNPSLVASRTNFRRSNLIQNKNREKKKS